MEQTAADPSLPLPVGIGLDVGEAVQLEAGYRGGAFEPGGSSLRYGRTRREPGDVEEAAAVHLAGKVDNVRYSDRGELRLKGLDADPVRAFRVISEAGDPSERVEGPSWPFSPSGGRGAPLRLAERHRALAPLLALALVGAIVVPGLARPSRRGSTGSPVTRWRSWASRAGSWRVPFRSRHGQATSTWVTARYGRRCRTGEPSFRSKREERERSRTRCRWAPIRPASRSTRARCWSPTAAARRCPRVQAGSELGRAEHRSAEQVLRRS